MLIHPLEKDMLLIELTDLNLPLDKQSPVVRENQNILGEIVQWAEEFLCRSHPQLGREGAVCPYVRKSMVKNLMWIGMYQEKNAQIENVRNIILRYRDWFLDIEPRDDGEKQQKAILVLFPNILAQEASGIIDKVQADLKPAFVDEGLMIGQFHVMCDEPGLRNPEFRPLRSPIPLIAIRHMVPTDFPFLKHDRRFVAAYLRTCACSIPKKLQGMVESAMREFDLVVDGHYV